MVDVMENPFQNMKEKCDPHDGNLHFRLMGEET
jgi:hypothetical protein